MFYKRDLPAKSLPPLQLKLQGLKPGKYVISVYRTGYQANDPYTAYFNLQSPSQLTVDQVNTLKQHDNDAPVEHLVVNINSLGNFDKQFAIRQNDVLLVSIKLIK